MIEDRKKEQEKQTAQKKNDNNKDVVDGRRLR